MSKLDLSNMTVTELLDLRNSIDSAIHSNVDLLHREELLKTLDKDYFEYAFEENSGEVVIYYRKRFTRPNAIDILDLKDDYLERKIDALNRNKVEIGSFLDMSKRLSQNLATIDYAFCSVFYLKDSDDNFVSRINFGSHRSSIKRLRAGEVSVKLDHSMHVSFTRFMRLPFIAKIAAGDLVTYLRSDRQGDHLDLDTSYMCEVEDYFDNETVTDVMSVAKELNETYNEITFVLEPQEGAN